MMRSLHGAPHILIPDSFHWMVSWAGGSLLLNGAAEWPPKPTDLGGSVRDTWPSTWRLSASAPPLGPQL